MNNFVNGLTGEDSFIALELQARETLIKMQSKETSPDSVIDLT